MSPLELLSVQKSSWVVSRCCLPSHEAAWRSWCGGSELSVVVLLQLSQEEPGEQNQAAHLRPKTAESQWFVSGPVLHQTGSYLDKVGLLIINHQSNCEAGALSNIKRDDDHQGSEITGVNQRSCRLSGIFSQLLTMNFQSRGSQVFSKWSLFLQSDQWSNGSVAPWDWSLSGSEALIQEYLHGHYSLPVRYPVFKVGIGGLDHSMVCSTADAHHFPRG